MKLLPFRRHRTVSRGQALVEFAIILPILALMLLLAIDFGRVFFGWVALNNATRIAANEAALNPDAWVAPVNAPDQARYRQQILNDMQAINCAPVGGGAWGLADIPDPIFEDKGGTIDAHEIGDHATVDLECGFTFLTPLVGNIMGNPMTISARSQFAIRGGVINGIPVATAIPSGAPPSIPPGLPCTAPQLVGETVTAGQVLWILNGFTGSYNVVRPPNNNYTIGDQFPLVFGQPYPCTSNITVDK
ncbi:MAG: TadE/TadG family type IV pilus assembly protein [Chloroflexota bacterium]